MPHIKNALIRFRIIDKMIRNKYKSYPSKKELREACEESLYGSIDGVHICNSTIEKDLFNMKMDHDAPIKYSKKNRGYYYEDSTYSINDIPLSEDELSSIKYAVDTLHQFKETPFFKEFGNAIDKIVDRISVGGAQNEMSKYIQFEAANSVGGNEFLPILLEAIQRKKKVWFIYTSFIRGQGKPRKVSPLFLKEYRNRWYLISYDASQKDIRTFALDRMEDPKILEDEQITPQGFDADTYFQNAMGITSYKGEAKKIIIQADEIASKYIKSQPIHHSQEILKESKDGTYFTFKLLLSEELIRTLLSYGGEIEIIEPEQLKKALKERISAMKKRYNL
ncbi:MAG: hypothetical protein CL857_03215 [Cryomorphaceae bacterium]|nr:hypothetical protein [Cryomorphaceae bacterium]|tara:strand:- start:11470 stop:12477 length:1008 start_codon:yes stop_codon:yes gene_type:complete